MNFNKYEKIINFIIQELKTGKRNEIPKDIYFEYFTFRMHFFKYLGISELSNLRDYSEQVLAYINDTTPYCFIAPLDRQELDDALRFYIVSLGGNSKQADEIFELLKNTSMTNINKDFNYSNNHPAVFEHTSINLNNIVGTTINAYQSTNLYDALNAIDDKGVSSFMEYLIINNVFNNQEKFNEVFKGIATIIDKNGNIYINEGNHRVFTYITLLKIRDYLGLESKSKNFEIIPTATIKK